MPSSLSPARRIPVSRVPTLQYLTPVKCSALVRRAKNHKKMQFFLHTCKFFTTFATANQKFADILLKAFISACFRDSKSCKISSYLKQEGSKRPLGYDYPAHRASFVGLLCLVAFHIRRGRSLLILMDGSCRNLKLENKQR